MSGYRSGDPFRAEDMARYQRGSVSIPVPSYPPSQPFEYSEYQPYGYFPPPNPFYPEPHFQGPPPPPFQGNQGNPQPQPAHYGLPQTQSPHFLPQPQGYHHTPQPLEYYRTPDPQRTPESPSMALVHQPRHPVSTSVPGGGSRTPPQRQLTERPPTARAHQASGRRTRPRVWTRQGPEEKTFFLLGSALDPCELSNRLTNYAVYAHGPSHPLSLPVSDFCTQLTSVYGELDRCRRGKRFCEQGVPSERKLNSKHIFESYIDRARDFYPRAQELITMCEGIMHNITHRGDGSVIETASERFISALVSHDQQLGNLETLSNDMRNWVRNAKENCATLLARLRGEAQLSDSGED